MSADKIAALVRALEAGPTPGPWTTPTGDYVWAAGDVQICVRDEERNFAEARKDILFIAASREGVPALVARVQRLEQALQELLHALDTGRDHEIWKQTYREIMHARVALAEGDSHD